MTVPGHRKHRISIILFSSAPSSHVHTAEDRPIGKESLRWVTWNGSHSPQQEVEVLLMEKSCPETSHDFSAYSSRTLWSLWQSSNCFLLPWFPGRLANGEKKFLNSLREMEHLKTQTVARGTTEQFFHEQPAGAPQPDLTPQSQILLLES